MKKLTSLIIIAVTAVGLFAQGTENASGTERRRNRLQRETREPRNTESVTISGILKLERGFVAVQSGENTIITPSLNRYIGFIDGLQEGKTVSIEGFLIRNVMNLKKLTIDGREYDLAYGNAIGFAPCFRAVPHRFEHSRGMSNRGSFPRNREMRDREDRRNRENRQRRNAPQSCINMQTDAV